MITNPGPAYSEQWFWSLIHLVQRDRDELKRILEGFTRKEIEHFQDYFVEFAAEFQGEPYEDFMEASEDGQEDIAQWVVSGGKELYEAAIENPASLPWSVEGKGYENLYGVANEVYYDRFKEEIGIY